MLTQQTRFSKLSSWFTLSTFVAVFGIVAGNQTAAAQDDDPDTPDPIQWLNDLEAKGDIKGQFPYQMIFVEAPAAKKGELPKLLEMDADVFTNAAFFRTVDSRNLEWGHKLNSKAIAELVGHDLLRKFSPVDTIVEPDSSGDWVFYHNGQKSTHKAQPPLLKNAQGVADWVLRTLGWDGVVLDQRGDFLLVGSTAKILSQPQIQALAIKDSHTKYSITQAERQGAGLLSLSKIKGGVGVFDIVFLGKGVKKMPRGTKLIIEKKKG